MNKTYKIILTLWLACGIALTGLQHIEARDEQIRIEENIRIEQMYPGDFVNRWRKEYYYKRRDLALLGTVVGTILIIGAGWVFKNVERGGY